MKTSIIAIAAALATSSVLAADDWTVSEDMTLTADTAVDAMTVNSGVTLDLAGYKLTCSSLAGSGTITSLSGTTDLTTPDTDGTHVTWSTSQGDASGAYSGSGANLFNNDFSWPNETGESGVNGSGKRIMVATANLPLAVTYDFGDGTPQRVNKYNIYFARSAYTTSTRGPKDWTFEGSNDNATWTKLHSTNDVTWAKNSSPKDFTFSNTTAYRYYRITISASGESGSGKYLELNQLEYFNTNAGELHVNAAAGETVSSSLTITGKTKVVKEGAGTLSGITQIANGSGSSVEMVVDGGSVMTTDDNLNISTAGGVGVLTVNSGVVEVRGAVNTFLNPNDSSSSTGTINLNAGGTLKTRRIFSKVAARGTLNFNGGTLQQNSSHTMSGGLIVAATTVNVLENGGTIDSGDYAVTVGAAIGGTGAMRFKGGNTITLEGANTYTGGTTIELGTKVVTSNSTSKDTILGGLVIDGKSRTADGTDIVVFQYNSTLDAETDLAHVTFVNCGEGTEAKVSDKQILVDFFVPTWELDADHLTWSSLVEKYGTPADAAPLRITASDKYTLTIDQDVVVRQIAFTGNNPNVVVNSGCTVTADTVNFSAANTDYYVLNNGVVVLNGTGTTSMRFNNDSRGVYYVNAGTLLSAAQPEQGSNATPGLLPEGTNQFICVSSGATYDINGKANNTASVRLASGATIANSSASVTTSTKQMPQLILDGDATATITRSFGLVGTGNTETRLDLGTHTLTINGGGTTYSFFLDNTTISGTGKVFVEAGHLAAYRKPHGDDWSLEIGSSGRMTVGNLPSDNMLTVGDFVNNGMDVSAADGGALVVKGTLTPGNAIKKLTLADGSMVKASATVTQTVSTAFSASGTVTIDASEITKAQLDAADIPVLTVPAATSTSGVAWNVANPQIAQAGLRWEKDAGGTTKTLYLSQKVDNRLTSMTVTGETKLVGAGGVILSSLSIPADARLVLDPIATPIKVSATPTFAEGAKIALASDYAGVTLGRIVLMTYSGAATIPAGLFDTSSVAGGVATLSQEVAPDGTNKQLVLTVGDYANEAKEIRILPIGDSITHGYRKDLPGTTTPQQAQYRTAIAARLAANGFRPVMLGHLNQDADGTETTCDAAGVQQPDAWISHSGSSGDAIMTVAGGAHGGVRDNLHVYLDVAGEPDVITLLIGTNDLKLGKEADETFDAYTNLVWDIARQRPGTKIVGSTLLDRSDNDAAAAKVVAFNALLLDNLANLPANYSCTNLFLVTSHTISDVTFDGLHPTAKGFAPVAKGFAAKIMETLPLSTYAGPIDTELTDEPQAALGAAAKVPATYRTGMTHVFSIDSANASTNLTLSSPYTYSSGMPLIRKVKKVGYYLELVRKGTSRRRYVWVDFEVTDKTLGDIDFPWDGDNVDLVVDNLHVYSNDGGVHNVAPSQSGIKGVIEGTRFGVVETDDDKDIPADIPANKHGWNDTLNVSSGNYGCFQAHRIFSQTGDDAHWNNAEVLFAWNRWGGIGGNNEIGIGSFFLSDAFSDYRSMDYMRSSLTTKGAAANIDARAYQVRHLEIWVVPKNPGTMFLVY